MNIRRCVVAATAALTIAGGTTTAFADTTSSSGSGITPCPIVSDGLGDSVTLCLTPTIIPNGPAGTTGVLVGVSGFVQVCTIATGCTVLNVPFGTALEGFGVGVPPPGIAPTGGVPVPTVCIGGTCTPGTVPLFTVQSGAIDIFLYGFGILPAPPTVVFVCVSLTSGCPNGSDIDVS